MNKLKDTRIFGDLIVDDSITKNNKEVATEEYVDDKLDGKVDKDGNKVLSTNDYTTAEKNKLASITSWIEVWSGSANLNSYTNSYYSAGVPSDSYIGKRIAIEVQYGTGTSYTSKIIFGVLGNSSATTAATSVARGIGWSYFDGTYLRVKTLYAYTSTGTTSTIYVGHLKTLFGTFSGTTIDWKTSHSETLYMKKIWVIE